jgi:acyl-CoA thioesterase FadM
VILEYLEAARVHWLASLGLRLGRILAVVMRVEVDYRREIFAGELVVRTRLIKGAEEVSYRATFHQTIEIGDGVGLAVDARIDVAFIEAASRNLCTFQDFLEAGESAGR